MHFSEVEKVTLQPCHSHRSRAWQLQHSIAAEVEIIDIPFLSLLVDVLLNLALSVTCLASSCIGTRMVRSGYAKPGTIRDRKLPKAALTTDMQISTLACSLASANHQAIH